MINPSSHLMAVLYRSLALALNSRGRQISSDKLFGAASALNRMKW
jgi:hypothetical protein